MQNSLNPTQAANQNDDDLYLAIAREFAPAPYHGRVLLLRRTDRANEWDGSWDLGWKDVLTGDLEIQTVGGNHVTIFEEPHVTSLATLLRDRFDALTKIET
jgi:thioesterase domain-containing protein